MYMKEMISSSTSIAGLLTSGQALEQVSTLNRNRNRPSNCSSKTMLAFHCNISKLSGESQQRTYCREPRFFSTLVRQPIRNEDLQDM